MRVVFGSVGVLVLLVSMAWGGEKITVGVGSSENTSARLAGAEAAKKAKDALGGGRANVVIVFSARSQLGPELVDGVAESFDKALICGCEGYSPVT